MRNFIQPGTTITAPAPYARTAGQAALIGALLCVALSDVANGASGEWMVEGVFDLAKAPSQAWATIGAAVYWDNTNKRLTTVASGNTLVGAVMGVVGNGAGETTGRVRLNGVARPPEA